MIRRHAVLGPARSGSTYLYRLIKDHSPDFSSKLKDEFFQTDLNGYYVYDNGHCLYQSNGIFDDKYTEITRRINLLEKYGFWYTIKCVPHQLTNNIIDCVVENYNIVFCERKDIYDRFLSFCLASETRIFNSETKIKRKNRSVHISGSVIDSFFEIENKWQADKKRILEKQSCKTIYYEDLIECPAIEINSKTVLRYTENRTPFYKQLVKLDEKYEKENLISNIDDVYRIFINQMK